MGLVKTRAEPSLTTVSHTDRYKLLDKSVHFIKGFFNASAPVLSSWMQQESHSIAVLRLDGDMYVSLMDCLNALYHHVSTNGFVIIDDWQISEAKQAVQDFRAKHSITSEIMHIDNFSVYWRKQ